MSMPGLARTRSTKGPAVKARFPRAGAAVALAAAATLAVSGCTGANPAAAATATNDTPLTGKDRPPVNLRPADPYQACITAAPTPPTNSPHRYGGICEVDISVTP